METMMNRANKLILIQAILIAFVLTLVIQGRTLWQHYLITDDIAQHHIWLELDSKSGLRGDDPWIMTSKAIQPYLAVYVFQGLHYLLPTLLVGKFLALGSLLITSLWIFYLGVKCGGMRVGWFSLFLFFISDAWIGISGGFARTFAWPLVSLFLLSLISRKTKWTAWSLFLSAALYPIVFVLLVPAWGMVLLYDELMQETKIQNRISKIVWQQVPVILAMLLGSALILIKSRELALHPLVGPQVSLTEIQTNLLYSPDGRWPLWPQATLFSSLPWSLMAWGKTILEPVVRHLSHNMQSAVIVCISGISILIPVIGIVVAFRKSPRNGFVICAFIVSGIMMFLIAKSLLPKLYEPSRYLVWSMPVIAIIAWALVFDYGLLKIQSPTVKNIILGLLIVAFMSRIPAISGKGAEDVAAYKAMYEELTKTEKGALIASFPRTSDFIPLFSGRSIFVSHESSHAVLFSNYRDLMVERQTALIDALYAKRFQVVQDFCKHYKVDWLIIEEKYYKSNMEAGVHFAPFEKRVRENLKNETEPYLLLAGRRQGKEIQPGVYLLQSNKLKELTLPKS